ncbi:uncharacterized protein K452DRAFT_8329 [Aplosporella prunicola CBS 121167]|uniref:DUF7580 domain-containing protein n=1 Tax=Aplosporella prunicola CBS 121167 TaxID=1176127 RepID=A0A6A6BXQ0_9PEZI|nr:uncharacterized protein K452DRAFT_8329 [Aplosporella prunicola CBS 121167]KAF2147511.1 hypothetical protein K452DRAFT_8329 [Aplosporella prunicola CBS 121167]
MSGFEVIGVLLGAWPLLVQGLISYKERADMLLKHEETMNGFIWKLRVEHTVFRSSCERLIDGLAEDADLEGLLTNPNVEAWKNSLRQGLDKKLKSRLGHSLEDCWEALFRLAINIEKLMTLAGLGEQDKSIRDSLSKYQKKSKRREEMWRKLKDCISYDKQNRLLKEIEGDNGRLGRLLPITLGQEFDKASRPRKADIRRCEYIRRSAKSLYCALCSGWLCQCQHAHSAHLRLEDNISKAERPRFRIAFSYGLNPTGSIPTSWTWQETEVEEGEDEPTPSLVPFRPTVALQTSASTNQEIFCLCSALKKNKNLNTASSCLGYISGTQRKHYVHLARSSPSACTYGKPVSLHEILSTSSNSSSNISSPTSHSISFHDKLGLAVLLASSLLQFQSSSPSWIEPQWTSQDVQFIPNASNTLLDKCAYISKTFLTPKKAAQTCPIVSDGISSRKLFIRSEAVFALGTTLVELAIEATLGSVQTDHERAQSDISDLYTALRLAKETEQVNVPKWNAVVKRCLRCEFQASPDFENKAFRREFHDSIVAPLRDIYEG